MYYVPNPKTQLNSLPNTSRVSVVSVLHTDTCTTRIGY